MSILPDPSSSNFALECVLELGLAAATAISGVAWYLVTQKADRRAVEALHKEKADKLATENLQHQLNSKAEKETVAALAKEVDSKASRDQVTSLVGLVTETREEARDTRRSIDGIKDILLRNQKDGSAAA